MTSATVIIRCDDGTCILGKVRHNGQDVFKFFHPGIFKLLAFRIWPTYIWWRESNRYDCPGEEIETKYDGFPFPFETTIDVQKEPVAWFNVALSHAKNLIQQLHQDAESDGYLCDHTDCELLVDCVNREIFEISSSRVTQDEGTTYVALVGNFVEGFKIIGPFDDEDKALDLTQNCDAWVTPLVLPSEIR